MRPSTFAALVGVAVMVSAQEDAAASAAEAQLSQAMDEYSSIHEQYSTVPGYESLFDDLVSTQKQWMSTQTQNPDLVATTLPDGEWGLGLEIPEDYDDMSSEEQQQFNAALIDTFQLHVDQLKSVMDNTEFVTPEQERELAEAEQKLANAMSSYVMAVITVPATSTATPTPAPGSNSTDSIRENHSAASVVESDLSTWRKEWLATQTVIPTPTGSDVPIKSVLAQIEDELERAKAEKYHNDAMARKLEELWEEKEYEKEDELVEVYEEIYGWTNSQLEEKIESLGGEPIAVDGDNEDGENAADGVNEDGENAAGKISGVGVLGTMMAAAVVMVMAM